ncbi:MAG UNVERIFIED_CONTAM: hypothetical protein LVR18_46175, partial [Planctomycetaceae bacterium]
HRSTSLRIRWSGAAPKSQGESDRVPYIDIGADPERDRQIWRRARCEQGREELVHPTPFSRCSMHALTQLKGTSLDQRLCILQFRQPGRAAAAVQSEHNDDRK